MKLQSRDTTRMEWHELARHIAKSVGAVEVLPPPKPSSTLPAFIAFAISGWIVGLLLVLLVRWLRWV